MCKRRWVHYVVNVVTVMHYSLYNDKLFTKHGSAGHIQASCRKESETWLHLLLIALLGARMDNERLFMWLRVSACVHRSSCNPHDYHLCEGRVDLMDYIAKEHGTPSLPYSESFL